MTQKWIKQQIIKRLSNLEHGFIKVTDQNETYEFGQASTDTVEVNILDQRFYTNIIRHGSLGAAQSFIEGHWQCSNLTQLLRVIIQNENTMNQIDGALNKLSQFVVDTVSRLRKNTISRSKSHIHAHYDLGNTFFETFLDETMLYSCALFLSEQDTLKQAQLNKLNRIVTLLDIQPGDSILEIGTGWGSLAIYCAQHFDCHVTTTTISEQQYAYSKQKIADLNLQDKITLLDDDYRQLKGRYDKIVSIEMIEAVGHQFYDDFFKQCNDLLKPGGRLMIQAILINEQNYGLAKDHVDFIKRYIFPGGCLPSIARIGDSIARVTQLQWLELNDIGQHYVTTLQHWQKHFMDNKNQILAQGFSMDFILMWQYYFCYCEAGFKENYISDVHMLWRKR